MDSPSQLKKPLIGLKIDPAPGASTHTWRDLLSGATRNEVESTGASFLPYAYTPDNERDKENRKILSTSGLALAVFNKFDLHLSGLTVFQRNHFESLSH